MCVHGCLCAFRTSTTMTLLVPDLWDADDDIGPDQDEQSINESFTDVLRCLVHGQFTPDEAVGLWGECCTSFARQASAVAQGLDYSTQSRVQEEVRELRDEANTWSLLKHAFCRCPCPSYVSPPRHISLFVAISGITLLIFAALTPRRDHVPYRHLPAQRLAMGA